VKPQVSKIEFYVARRMGRHLGLVLSATCHGSAVTWALPLPSSGALLTEVREHDSTG
jgi:hypothetical protein